MLTLALLAGGFVGVTFVMVRVMRFTTGIVRRPIENACAKLAAEGFTVTHGMMSVSRDLMIALDKDNRVALCELGRRGVVLTTRRVDRADITAEAIEDGEVLDDDAGAVPRKGKLLLRLTYKRRAYEIVFAHSVPQSADSPPDYEEYAQMRGMVAWWRDTLSGRAPNGTYPLASRLAVFSSGSVIEQIARDFIDKLDNKPEFPSAVARLKPPVAKQPTATSPSAAPRSASRDEQEPQRSDADDLVPVDDGGPRLLR